MGEHISGAICVKTLQAFCGWTYRKLIVFIFWSFPERFIVNKLLNFIWLIIIENFSADAFTFEMQRLFHNGRHSKDLDDYNSMLRKNTQSVKADEKLDPNRYSVWCVSIIIFQLASFVN